MSVISWILDKTPRDQIISGIVFLLSPFKIFGFPSEKMALRIELIFRCLDDVQTTVIDKKEKLLSEIKKDNQIGNAVSKVYFDIMELVEEEALDEIKIDLYQKVSLKQWMFPLFLFVTLFLIQTYT